MRKISVGPVLSEASKNVKFSYPWLYLSSALL